MRDTLDDIIQMAEKMPGNNIVFEIKDDQIILRGFTEGIPSLMGIEKEEYEQCGDLFLVVLDEDREMVQKKMKDCFLLQKKEKGDFSFRLIHKDTGFIWVHMVASVMERLEDQIVIICTLVDVTKEMVNSYALMEASERCICVVERQTKKILYANAPFYELIDSNPSRCMGKFCYEVLCQNTQMKTNNHCICFSCTNTSDPVTLYDEKKKRYFNMTGRQIIWGEHESYVFFITDITKEKQKDAMLADSVKRFNVALDNSDLMIWEYDMVNHRCINSEKAGRDYNIPLVIENYPESLFETGHTPPETIEQIKEVKRRLLNGETGFSVERRTIDKYGKSNWQKVDYSLEYDEHNKPIRAIVCGLDITEKKELEKKYEEQMEYRNNLADKAMFSTRLDLDQDTILDYTCNEPALESIIEKAQNAKDCISLFFETSVFNPDSEISKERLMPTALKESFRLGQRQYQTMYRCSLLNKFLELNLSMYKNPSNNHLEVFFVVLDVSNNAFLHDPVTGLYNRVKTYLECNRILKEHPDETLVMVHFDIQRFRLYNSFFGEEEGDRLLCYIADMFRELYGTHRYGVYGRIEADVFLLCFPLRNNVLEWNQQYIHEYLAKYREDFQIVANCGAYIVKDRSLTVEAMFNRASIAAKSNTKQHINPICIFDDEMERAILQEQEIIREMKKAIEEKQFHVYLQPKYKLVTGEAFGAEALVRWVHPQKGIISPGRFIPIFEKNGFITRLDQYMWEHVCILIRKWLDQGINPAPISVNMSRVSMYSPKTVDFLVDLIKKYKLSPKLLNLELTESAYMDDPEVMKERLKELRSFGFKIMMDDFGSGYSSLNTLRDIPVDYLKVDRGFLASVDHSKRSRLVLASVVHMAARMGIPVITEGVETESQKEFLTSIGCDFVQGFLYARPMPVIDYEKKYMVYLQGDFSQHKEEETKLSDLALEGDEHIQYFSNLLPFPFAFMEYVGDSFNYLSANQKFLETFGMRKDIMEMKDMVSTHVSYEDYETLRSTYENTSKTGRSDQCIITWKNERNKSTSYLVKVSYVGKNIYSSVLAVAFIAMKIDCGLNNEERTMEALFENVPGGIVLYKWDGIQLKTLHISKWYEKQYRSSLISRGENVGGPDFKRIHPDDAAEYKKAIHEAIQGSGKMQYVFRSWNEEYHRYLWTKMDGVLEQKKDGTALCYVMYTDVTAQQDALEREKRLSRCLKLMTNDEYFEENLSEVMKLVELQYKAERVYIFEFDWKQGLMSNTYEYVAEGVSQEKENLQNLPIEVIDYWMEYFRKSESVILENIEEIKDIPERKAEYDTLKPQGIHSLMVFPITKNNHLYGYVGVDNPSDDVKDKAFLTSVAHILSQEFFSREQQSKLVELSLKDPLTKLKNRHSYNKCIHEFSSGKSRGTGVVFADVNGLKYMNDNFGHREGDKLICLAAEILVENFSETMTYRISGDEFVVISEKIKKIEFLEKAESMKQKVLEEFGSVFSIGIEWEEGEVDIENMVMKAEEQMYINKEQYYKANPLKKRKNMIEIVEKEKNKREPS